MGSFLGSVHVRTQDGLSTARDTLLALLAADSWAPTDGPAERTLALVQGDRWLHVYDDGCEGGDAVALDAAAGALSRALHTGAFSMIVHDSDFLMLRLYEDGADRGRWASDEAAGVGRKKPDRAAWARQAATDAHARADDARWAGVFEGDPVFAEERLGPLGALLGADVDRLNCRLAELPPAAETDGAETDGAETDGVVRIALRDSRRKAPTASGPPRLALQMPPPPIQAAVDGTAHIGLAVANHGGPSQGLRLWVEGADGIVLLDQLRLFTGGPRGGVEAQAFAGSHQDESLPLPCFEPLDPRSLGGGRMHAAMDRMFASQVTIGLTGRGLAPGTGTLVVHVQPLHPDGVGVSVPVPVTVQSTADRPLRAPADVHPTMLEALRGDTWLCALVAGPDVEALLGLVDAAAAHFPTDGKLHHAIFSAPSRSSGLLAMLQGAMSGPKQGSAKAAGFWRGKRWQTLADAAREGHQIDLSFGERDGMDAGTAQVLLGRGIIPSPDALPVLAVCLRAGDLDAARDRLVLGIDGLADRGLIQAVVTRWGSRTSNELSPYEAACQVHGQCTLDEAWLRRWLRAVGPGALWLGPDLRARVEEEALAQVAALTEVGPALRVDITTLMPVEEALAAVLPSAQDWMEGQQARYGGPGR